MSEPVKSTPESQIGLLEKMWDILGTWEGQSEDSPAIAIPEEFRKALSALKPGIEEVRQQLRDFRTRASAAESQGEATKGPKIVYGKEENALIRRYNDNIRPGLRAFITKYRGQSGASLPEPLKASVGEMYKLDSKVEEVSLDSYPETEEEYFEYIESLGGMIWRIHHDLADKRPWVPPEAGADAIKLQQVIARVAKDACEQFGIEYASADAMRSNLPLPEKKHIFYWDWYKQQKAAWEKRERAKERSKAHEAGICPEAGR